MKTSTPKTRRKAKPIRITNTDIRCPYSDHRGDFETCPHCRCHMAHDEWQKHTIEFTTAEVQGKHGSGAIIAECPKCFQKSWVHVELGYTSHLPKEIEEAAEREHLRRKLAASREWGASLCWKCKHLKEPHISTHAWRDCIRGLGPAEKECKKFEAL
jgi:hypothetical protein